MFDIKELQLVFKKVKHSIVVCFKKRIPVYQDTYWTITDKIIRCLRFASELSGVGEEIGRDIKEPKLVTNCSLLKLDKGLIEVYYTIFFYFDMFEVIHIKKIFNEQASMKKSQIDF